MSDDLIKRSDAIKIMACEMYAEAQSQGYETDSIEDFIPEAKAWMNDAPSADRPSGEWQEKETFNNEDSIIEHWQSARCSMCERYHTTPYMYYFNDYNFCPYCGADMRKGESRERSNNESAVIFR